MRYKGEAQADMDEYMGGQPVEETLDQLWKRTIKSASETKQRLFICDINGQYRVLRANRLPQFPTIGNITVEKFIVVDPEPMNTVRF